MSNIKDVAKLAGVGVGTVSRVINNANVKDNTREKVFAAIDALNYTPNEVARNLKMNKSQMVALLLPSVWHPFFSKFAYFIEDCLDRNGYKLLLCNSGGKPEKELYYLDMLKKNKVAGIICITYNDTLCDLKYNIPIVSIDRHFTDNVVCVTSDNFNGGKIALDELVKNGCRNVAFIGDKTEMPSGTNNRKSGFVMEAEKIGVRYNVYEQPAPINDYNVFLKRFLQKYPDVDGVFAITDLLAAQLIYLLNQNNKNVPADIKVIGYDGIQDSNIFHPYLSSICQPVEQIAQEAVNVLIDLISDKKINSNEIILPVSFRKGETTL